jgi:hypothetical protein
VSGDQAELPGSRGSLGAVGGAGLAQDVRHVLFRSVQRRKRFAGDPLVGLPAAISRGTPSSLVVSCSTRLGTDQRRPRAAPCRSSGDAGCQRQRPQRADLDDAAGPAWTGR